MGHLHDDDHINPSAIEIFPGASAGHGGYIDFHYNDNTSDYTSRILESAKGVLMIYGSITTNGAITAPAFYAKSTLGIPINFVKSDKSNTDTNWYQDIQFATSDSIRVSVIRSQVDSSGNRNINIGVSSNTNAAPTGIMIKRVDNNGSYVYATAPTNTVATAQIRNIQSGTAAKTSGTSSLTSGTIYVQYE